MPVFKAQSQKVHPFFAAVASFLLLASSFVTRSILSRQKLAATVLLELS